MVPTTVLTWTVVPSVTLMSWSTPEAGAGISASTLSVEISNSGSSRWTLSPGFFSHLVMVPSTIDSPIWGMMISVAIIPFRRPRQKFTTGKQNIIAFRLEAGEYRQDTKVTANRTNVPERKSRLHLHAFAAAVRRNAEGILPVLLHRGWEFIQPGQESSDLPDLVIGERFSPGRHSGVAYAGGDCVMHMPFRVVERINYQLRDRRIKRLRQRAGFVVEAAMAPGAIHGVDLHAFDEIVICRRHGIADVRGVAVHGCVHGMHGNVAFNAGRSGVCIGGHKTEECKSQAGRNNYDYRDDDPNNEVAHVRLLKMHCRVIGMECVRVTRLHLRWGAVNDLGKRLKPQGTRSRAVGVFLFM